MRALPLICSRFSMRCSTLQRVERRIEREAERTKIAARITSELDNIPLLDDDRILRNLLALNERNAAHQFLPNGQSTRRKPSHSSLEAGTSSGCLRRSLSPRSLSIRRVSKASTCVPDRVARGGLRWSDRQQDFRTEILSLAKAQQVKNVVIVPQGAKGGFVPREACSSRTAKRCRPRASPATSLSSQACFRLRIISSRARSCRPPIRSAAMATIPILSSPPTKARPRSRTSRTRFPSADGFWLGDAFASGGSAGYDHKKMGITARGAWEAVKRHFREMNVDIQTQPFTVAGIGDMSGDVFGNGMLLSKAIKLVAAFDHRDIFIDPNPDPELSWEERKRLFDLPRSSWQDYDRSRLSAGGGIYSRGQKVHHAFRRGAKSPRHEGGGHAERAPDSDIEGPGRSSLVRRHRHLCPREQRDGPCRWATRPTMRLGSRRKTCGRK